ncbi:MAG: hypothetical protein NC339_01445 [Muribaculaceae bacterium]|nr:hypothetical protein [Muribaculaceae bacterium]
MNILRDDKDYFLSNFDDEEKKKEDTPAADTPDGQNTDASTQGGSDFQFTGPVPTDAEAAQTPQPKPRKRRHRWWWFWLCLFALAAGAFYVRYFVPHTEESKITGYVTNVEKRGIVFKTFEGEMISENQLTDSSHIYQRDVVFSMPNDSLGRAVQAWQGSGKPVVLTVKKYYGTLPWRGATNTIVTDVRAK